MHEYFLWWTTEANRFWWHLTLNFDLENKLMAANRFALPRKQINKTSSSKSGGGNNSYIAYDEYSQSITWNCQSRLERAVVSIWTSRVNFKTCFSRARARLCIITELCNHRSLRLSASKTIVGDLETETQVSRTPTQYAF